MECAVITTYRCNARCDMCEIWKSPSNVKDEIDARLLEKLPNGLDKINVTGGEPGLRKDLLEIVSILRTKAKKIDISTNGFFTERLVEVAKKFPETEFRISVEGFPKKNDELRGIKDGFDRALKTVLQLKKTGVKSVGFGMVISDKNKDDLLDLYYLCSLMGIEFGSSTLHNSFYFNKFDNDIIDLDGTVNKVQEFIVALLRSQRTNIRLRIKDWGRAYINFGLLNHIEGAPRHIPCGAATELFFLDPFGNILACNGSDVPWIMGDLKVNTFSEIWSSKQADEAREKVKKCKRNCWMVGSARPAMRSHIWVPVLWIIKNKIKLLLNKNIWN